MNNDRTSYDDLKVHQGRPYSGMAVGASHHWLYPDGRWNETKVAPDRWSFTFTATKRRIRPAPGLSGARPDTRYHWFMVADQFARKIDKDAYETFMHGLKFKIGHKRPHWKHFSYEYPDRQPVGKIKQAMD